MLGKLFKHEFKDTYLLFAVCLITMALTTLAGVFMFLFGAWDRAFQNDNGYAAGIVFSYIGLAFFVFYGSLLVSQYYFVWRYHKNLFTDQGYLMHTLPVKSGELIGAKLLVAVLWQYVIALAGTLCIVALIVSIVAGVGEDIGLSLSDLTAEINAVFDDPDFVKGLPFVICSILTALVFPFVRALYMYVCVGLGQLAKKGKFIVALVLIFGIRFVLRIVGQFFRFGFLITADNFFDDLTPAMMNVFGVLMLILMGAAGVGMFFLARYFIDKKLNLE